VSVPAYPEFKDSGVPWLGAVPIAWSVERFRHVFRESGEKIEVEVVGPMLSVSGYRGIEIKEYDDENRRRLDEELVGYRIVRPGQLVVNTMWLNYAGLGVSDHEGHVSPAYRSYWIEREVDRRFIHHLMRSSIYVQGYTRLLTGIRPNSLQMSRDDLMDFPVLLPPADEQATIAAFLDRETAKIDALVAEQERLIALLKEKRQAVISHAVTKGLNPDAPMKDSGIEWLGEIPAHWDATAVKQTVSLVTSGPRGWSDLASDDGAFFFQSQNIGRDMEADFSQGKRIEVPIGPDAERARLQLDDVAVCITGGRTGAVAHIDELAEDAFINQHVCVLRPRPGRIVGRYLAFSLFGLPGQEQLALAMYGLKQGLSLENVREVSLPLPPLDEQRDIAEFLNKYSSDVRSLISEAQSAITLLQERRAALISAAVTGKIEVRGLVDTPARANAELDAA